MIKQDSHESGLIDALYIKKPVKGCPIFQKRAEFINVDPVYKCPKLSRFLLNLNFLKNHFELYSAHCKSTVLLCRRLYSHSV